MALIHNASAEKQHVVVYGQHFDFAPGQTKNLQEHFAHMMATDKAYMGLVSLPAEFEDPMYASTEEGKKVLEERRATGINNRISHLRQVIYNNEVSLRRDLEMKNMKVDPKLMASDGEIAAYEELVKYQKKQEDEAAAKAARIAELQKKVASIK